MPGSPHPIDVLLIDDAEPGKAAWRGDERIGHRRVVADAQEVRDTDFTGQVAGLYVRSVQTNFLLDTGDVSADDGVTVIIDAAGNHFVREAPIYTGLPDPVNPQDAATKSYVDGVAQGLDVKPSVRCATTANITLSGEQTIDGILTSANRVLVKNQSTASQNGIYVSAAGAWTRAADNDSWLEVPGAYTFVEQGTVNGNTGWVSTADAGGTIGTTAMPWTQFAGIGSFTAGPGILLTGTQFSIDPATIDITDPGADKLWFWDDSVSKFTTLTPNASFEINGTTLRLIETHGIALSDETTVITTGTNKATMSLPYAFTVTAVYATLNTVSSSGTPTVDINEAGTTILSTKLTIDASEKTSGTAAAAAVISDAAIAAFAEIGFDIDVAGTGAKGLKVIFQGYRT